MSSHPNLLNFVAGCSKNLHLRWFEELPEHKVSKVMKVRRELQDRRANLASKGYLDRRALKDHRGTMVMLTAKPSSRKVNALVSKLVEPCWWKGAKKFERCLEPEQQWPRRRFVHHEVIKGRRETGGLGASLEVLGRSVSRDFLDLQALKEGRVQRAKLYSALMESL